MAREIPGARPAVISTETARGLDEFLAFRHIVRHLYAFDLDAQRLEELIQRLPDAWFRTRSDIEEFTELLQQAGDEEN